MSCHLVNKETIAWLAYELKGERRPGGWEGLAKTLAENNVASFRGRYGSGAHAEMVVKETENYVAEVMELVQKINDDCPMPGVMDVASPYEGVGAVTWIGVVGYLRYQSCDHWTSHNETEGKVYEWMTQCFVRKLPGVDDTWGGPGDVDFDEKHKRK